MLENDDWIFEDVFNEVAVPENTARQSDYSCQNFEKIQSFSSKQYRVVNKYKILSSLSRNNDTYCQPDLDTKIGNIKNNDVPFKNKNNTLRGDLLLGIFQENISQPTLNFEKQRKNEPSNIPREMQYDYRSKVNIMSKVSHKETKKENQVRCAKEVKLIRIFPGPAGLIPDMKNNVNILAASYLSNVEELEKDKVTTQRIEIKSQNEERSLIGEKAWKFLFNDLPKNFLQDYTIAAIKDKANASHCDSTKVRFIAGILDFIDYNYDDPFVILKDSTGTIEGTIHHDVPLTYPGILETNVVILLHDVGLLKTTTYVVTNKYHILISSVNLVAAYTDKGRIVSSSLVESTLIHTSDVKLKKIDDNMPISKLDCTSVLQNMDKCHDVLAYRAGSFNNLSNIQIKNNKSKLSKDSLSYLINEKNKHCEEVEDDKRNNRDRTFEHINYLFSTDDLDDFLIDYESTSLKKKDLNPSCKKNTRANIIQPCNLVQVGNTNEEPTIISTNFHKQMPEIRCNVKNSKSLINYFSNDKYDSDDEILSQLDVSNIFDEPK